MKTLQITSSQYAAIANAFYASIDYSKENDTIEVSVDLGNGFTFWGDFNTSIYTTVEVVDSWGGYRDEVAESTVSVDLIGIDIQDNETDEMIASDFDFRQFKAYIN